MDALAESLLEEAPIDYDSDAAADEISAPQAKSRELGLRTVAQIFKYALENRTNSKKALKEHLPQARAPATQNTNQRWLNIFKAFMKTLGVPDDTVPNGDHIYRFVDTVSHMIKSRYLDKPAPSVQTIRGGLTSLSKTLLELHEDFTMSKSKSLQIDSLLNKLVKDKVLVAGRWLPSNRIGFKTLLFLIDTWMNSGLIDGVNSWDTYISRQLSIVLMASLASRSGDVLRTQVYEDMECCLFKDLTVSFQDGDSMEHLSMNVCLRFVKGYKQLPNVDRHLRVNILSSVAHNSVCPVKLLIIHALRIGAVDSTAWESLRAKTIARADKTIQWTMPENPVIPAITMGRKAFLSLQKPASTHQAIATMNAMSIKAKCVVRLRVHDLRYGSARDLAHLPANVLRGNSSMAVATAMGHKMSSFMSDVTEQYVGGSDFSTWNLRAQSDWKDSRAPRMGSTAFVPKPLREGELQEYCKTMGWNPSKDSNIRNARVHIRKAQESEWRASLKDEPAQVSSSVPKPRPVLQPLGGNSTRGINADVTRKQPRAKKSVSTPVDPQLLTKSSSATAISSTHVTDEDSDEDSDEDDHDRVLDAKEEKDATQLLNIVMARIDAPDLAMNEDADLLDTLDDAPQTFNDTDPVHLPGKDFVAYFSRINIIRNQIAGKLSDVRFQQDVDKWAPQGNSRDTPTRFIYHCSNQEWGCQYAIHSRKRLEQHIRRCKFSESNPAKAADFPCRKPDCNRVFKTTNGRKSHEAEHGFESRQCDICQDDRLYTTKRRWNNHQLEYHGDWDPNTTCQVPECNRGNLHFKTRSAYQQHLRVTHGLSGQELAQYVPVTAARAFTWGKRKCPFDDCSHETTRKSVMHSHLTTSRGGGHDLCEEEAAEKMAEIIAG